jgi:hypothetical protein
VAIGRTEHKAPDSQPFRHTRDCSERGQRCQLMTERLCDEVIANKKGAEPFVFRVTNCVEQRFVRSDAFHQNAKAEWSWTHV